MKWLDDRVSTDELYLMIKDRPKKTEGVSYSFIMSRSLKAYIKQEGLTHVRFGWDVADGRKVVVLHFNNEGIGVELYGKGSSPKPWFTIDQYMKQYEEDDVPVTLRKDLRLIPKKTGMFELEYID